VASSESRNSRSGKSRKEHLEKEPEKVKLLARDLRDSQEYPEPAGYAGGYVPCCRAVDNAAPCSPDGKANTT
jgi:hypothetical protein